MLCAGSSGDPFDPLEPWNYAGGIPCLGTIIFVYEYLSVRSSFAADVGCLPVVMISATARSLRPSGSPTTACSPRVQFRKQGRCGESRVLARSCRLLIPDN